MTKRAAVKSKSKKQEPHKKADGDVRKLTPQEITILSDADSTNFQRDDIITAGLIPPPDYLKQVANAAANLADTLRLYESSPYIVEIRDALQQMEGALLPKRRSYDDPYRHAAIWSGWPSRAIMAVRRLWKIHDSYLKSFGCELVCEPEELFTQSKYFTTGREIHLPEKISTDKLTTIDECTAILKDAIAKLPPAKVGYTGTVRQVKGGRDIKIIPPIREKLAGNGKGKKKTDPKQPGRPKIKDDIEENRFNFVERWEKARDTGVSRADFCEDESEKEGTTIKLLGISGNDRPLCITDVSNMENWKSKRDERKKE